MPRKILDESVSIFGAMDTLLYDRGPNFIGKEVSNVAEQLGTKRVATSPFQTQANSGVERRNRTVAQVLECFLRTGKDNWELHSSQACLRYNTEVHDAAQLSPFEAMFGIDAFTAWWEVEADRVMGEPYSTSKHLKELQSTPLKQGMKASRSASSQYNRSIGNLGLLPGDSVMVWAPDLVSKERSKRIPRGWDPMPWRNSCRK